ncbi:MAG: aminoglycoside 3'-phosphotransferase [Phototrophicaceae bacterium]
MENLPPSIRSLAETAHIIQTTVGMSKDDVYRIESDAIYYLKIGQDLSAEKERLQWLDTKLPIPQIVHHEVYQGEHFLLTSAIQGVMMMSADLPVSWRIDLMAEAARMWHSLDMSDCPFDNTIRHQIKYARQKLDNEQVDERRFHSQFYGKTAHELYADLLNAMPDDEDEDLAVTHGDLCLPNILVDEQTGQITGFVDLGEIGVSDRHLDLVLASRSIQYNLGSKWIKRFYDAYGMKRDNLKYHFYSILNEFY